MNSKRIFNGLLPQITQAVECLISSAGTTSLTIDTASLYETQAFVPLFALVDATSSTVDVVVTTDAGLSYIVRAGTSAGYPIPAVPRMQVAFGFTGSLVGGGGIAKLTLINRDMRAYSTADQTRLVRDTAKAAVATSAPTVAQAGLLSPVLNLRFGSDIGLSSGGPLRPTYVADKVLKYKATLAYGGGTQLFHIRDGVGAQRLVITSLTVTAEAVTGGSVCTLQTSVILGAGSNGYPPMCSSVLYANSAAPGSGLQTLCALDFDGGYVSQPGDSLFLSCTALSGTVASGTIDVDIKYCLLNG
jgi:hypothetical protein